MFIKIKGETNIKKIMIFTNEHVIFNIKKKKKKPNKKKSLFFLFNFHTNSNIRYSQVKFRFF